MTLRSGSEKAITIGKSRGESDAGEDERDGHREDRGGGAGREGLLRLSDFLLSDSEMEFVRGLGGTILCDSARLVAVTIPGRHLVTLAAHMPSVVAID